jgi:hypothetical protein
MDKNQCGKTNFSEIPSLQRGNKYQREVPKKKKENKNVM